MKRTAVFLTIANLLFAQTVSAGVVEDIHAQVEAVFDRMELQPKTRRHITYGTAGALTGGVAVSLGAFLAAEGLHGDSEQAAAGIRRYMYVLRDNVSRDRILLKDYIRKSKTWTSARQKVRSDIKEYKKLRSALPEALWKIERWTRSRKLRWAFRGALAGGLLFSAVAIAISKPSQDEAAIERASLSNSPQDWWDLQVALMLAARTGNFRRVKVLLGDIGQTLPNGILSLTMIEAIRSYVNRPAFGQISLDDCRETIRILLRYGADVNVIVEGSASGGALHFAVSDKDMLKFLLAVEGVDINIQNSLGETPLMLAVLGNHPGEVRILLEAGANRHLKNDRGETALDIARRLYAQDLITILDRPGSPEDITEADQLYKKRLFEKKRYAPDYR